MRPARSISRPLRSCMGSCARRSARVDGSQRLDLSRARRAVLSWLALPAHDNDMDRQCDADRVAVHAGLRGLLSAGVPVRARELPDPNASQGHGDRIPQRAALLLATLTPPSTERLRKREGRRRWSAALPYGAKELAADPPLARVHRKRQNVPGGRSVDPPPAPVAHSAPS